MSKEDRTQYVLLPTRGITARAGTPESVAKTLVHAFRAMRHTPQDAPELEDVTVLDSIAEDGAKLVEMTPRAMHDLKALQPGLRIIPVVYYRPAWARHVIRSRVTAANAKVKRTIAFVVKDDQGTAVAGADIVAFANFKAGDGVEGKTNAQGKFSTSLPTSIKTFERIFIYPAKDVWGHLQGNVKIGAEMTFTLPRVDVAGYTDGLRAAFPAASPTDGQGVRVAVVDTGVDPHPDLKIAGGLNTVYGEVDTEYGDAGTGHGTHVAGIIAGQRRGVAPAVELYSYRVFGKRKDTATNFAIAKAIERAVQNKCDVINLSLGGGPPDAATAAAISDARQAGSVVLAAAGNDGRKPVNFPGADPLAVAVSAVGRKGTFPKTSLEQGDVAAPYGTDKNDFIAAFSNIGPEIDITGPGVGIISTVPGLAYGVMGGTSMACPAVAGFLARLLSRESALLAATRDANRADEILKLLFKSAKSLGFPSNMEGKGLPQ